MSKLRVRWSMPTLLGLLLLLSLPLRGWAQPLERELWYGVLETEARHFRFLLKIDELPTGQMGKLISLDEGGSEFPLDQLVKTDDRLKFKISVSGADYSSQFDAEAGEMQGIWKQRGSEFQLAFKPVDTPPQLDYEAIWQGEIKVLFQAIDIQVRELESGEVFFDSISQKAGGFVTTKEVEGKKVTFTVPGVRGEFEGELADDGQSIDGKWSQGLISTSLTLELAEEEASATASEPPARPQTPQAPFPYTIEEVVFENVEAGIQLAGTLTLPPAAKQDPVPAVVLISGSGPQDRDETILNHKPFWVIADFLTRQGIAVLRYDERGVGQSTGDFPQATSVDFADDVQAAVRYLRSQSQIDSSQIGLCGHSEGGLIAPMVAVRAGSEIAFVVLLAGPGVSGREILKSQSKLILQKAGVSEEEIERQGKLQSVFLGLAQREPPLTEAEFVEMGRQEIADILSESELEKEADKAMLEIAAKQLLNPWMRYFLGYQPEKALQTLQCPVLVLNGEKDLQVDPTINLPVIRAALKSAGNKDVTIRELPNLNHLFQTAETGLMDEYDTIEETFDPETLKLIADWIQETAVPQ